MAYPRQPVELLEDEGINPESKALQDEPTPTPQTSTDPFALILDTITRIKSMIEEGKFEVAKAEIKSIRTTITMGIEIARVRNDPVLKTKLERYKPLLDDLEAKMVV